MNSAVPKSARLLGRLVKPEPDLFLFDVGEGWHEGLWVRRRLLVAGAELVFDKMADLPKQSLQCTSGKVEGTDTHFMKQTRMVLSGAALLIGSLLMPRVIRSQATVTRPSITGLAHVGFFVADMDKAQEFYGHVLGYDHFSLDKPTGGLMLNYYKINDHQYVEIYPGLKGDDQDRLSHVAFETTDARGMRDYLAGKGVKVPAELKPGLDKNLSFMVDDPEGRRIEFVQYMPGSLHELQFGKLLPNTRVSERMIHTGFVVHDRAAEDKFYKDVLGFTVMWYGGMKEDEVKWVDMRVPDGDDWLEYMLGVEHPTPKTRGVMNHFALGVKDINDPDQEVIARMSTPPEKPKIGRDGKWQLNLYDPNLTRVELMEFKPTQTPCCSPILTNRREQ